MKKISGRQLFYVFKMLIIFLVNAIRLIPEFLVILIFGPFSHLPGQLGVFFRYIYWSRFLKSIGDAVYISRWVVLKNPHNIEIGHQCSIHEFCYIDGYGGVFIGDNVSIAHNCSILSTNHGWADDNRPIKYNEIAPASVIIDNDVWIGCGVRILAGVNIGSRTVVAAGAVVTRSLEGGALYAGVPARQIKKL